MPVLLELPREVRDNILELLVAAYTAPQLLPTGLTEYHDYDTNFWGAGDDVKYSNFIKTDIVPTILVNRQLNEETLSVIDRILERQSYLLEASVFEEKELRVKWVSVPALTTRVDHVRASILIEGVNKTGRSLFEGGDGGPAYAVWAFCSLLERFLKFGPVAGQNPETKSLDRCISIKTLEIDVRTPDVPEDVIEPQPEGRRGYGGLLKLRRRTGIDYIMRPKYLVEFLSSHLVILSQYPTSYGAMLYERVGLVKLMIDGQVYRELDLAIILASMRASDGDSAAARDPKLFKRWKKNAYKKRVEHGLPIVPENEVEAMKYHSG